MSDTVNRKWSWLLMEVKVNGQWHKVVGDFADRQLGSVNSECKWLAKNYPDAKEGETVTLYYENEHVLRKYQRDNSEIYKLAFHGWRLVR